MSIDSVNFEKMFLEFQEFCSEFQETNDNLPKFLIGTTKQEVFKILGEHRDLFKKKLELQKAQIVSQTPEPLQQRKTIDSQNSGRAWLEKMQSQKQEEAMRQRKQREEMYSAIIEEDNGSLSPELWDFMVADLDKIPRRWDEKVISNFDTDEYRKAKDAVNSQRRRLPIILEE